MGFATETYVNRINNQYKLDKNIEREPLEKITATIDEWSNKIGQSLINKDCSSQIKGEIILISKKFQKYLQMTLYIIQLAKFD